MVNFIENLEGSLHRGFINKEYNRLSAYKPQLLVNRKNENVLNAVVEGLNQCESFIFSVAFITESGLATLKSHLYDLQQKGVKGRILTATYLYFNQPKVFRELLKLSNVEVRITDVPGFHSKGYIFEQKGHYSLIVGSSNLTVTALKVNYEWNVKLTSHENGEIVHHFKNQFEDVWKDARVLDEQWITTYEREFEANKPVVQQVAEFPAAYNYNSIAEALKIVPNKMQEAALQGIQDIRDAGHDKGLIISATGTGKTYLSAFDVRQYSPKRMLFIVHREQILHKAKSDFQKVLGGIDEDFGVLSGGYKQSDAKYLFATIQSISKEDILRSFDPEAFEYILIDEVHKAGASSYRKVIDYFKPNFLMGMTATPERSDNFNIYELFNYNIAYEIRLQEALEEDMLCPFHYFGVTDVEYGEETIDDTTILAKLITEERVNHIIEKINYYGFSGEEVRGLIFCSRKDEAKKLSDALNEKGLRTVALTGDDSQEERTKRVEELESGVLTHILTVDIFNEGIDIPSVNQVVMLRQTQSSIIFIQQLGRGLRKHESKKFVTIIDFIGNYKTNYLIPMSLSGDKSFNKDNIRRHVIDTSYIQGVSTVNFEEIAQKRIFQAINNSNLTQLKILREAYSQLKDRIGRIPSLRDFVKHDVIDPVVIAKAYSNYQQFLLKLKEDVPNLTEYEDKVLTMLSLEVLHGKRKHEILLLDILLQQETVSHEEFLEVLSRNNCACDGGTLVSMRRVLDLSFFTQAQKAKYGENAIVTLQDNYYMLNKQIMELIQTSDYFKDMLVDVIKVAKKKSMVYQSEEPLTLYEKYTRKDACKLLNWTNDESSTMYGYKTKHGTCPIFFTYHKNDEVESSVAYGDEFLNPEVLKWYTRSNRTLESSEVKTIIHAKENKIDIHIFVKKDDDEGSDFYYLGKAIPDERTVQQEKMLDKHGKELPVVTMNMVMEQPLEGQLYSYIKESVSI